MNNTNKILLILVVVLVLVLVGLVFWQKVGFKPAYSAVYLRTGDLYFGKLTYFPFFGLRNVYTIQINQQDARNPLSIQKFSNVFWGPADYLKINRNEVVWTTKLRDDSELLNLLKTNPDLTPQNPPTKNTLPSSEEEAPTGEE